MQINTIGFCDRCGYKNSCEYKEEGAIACNSNKYNRKMLADTISPTIMTIRLENGTNQSLEIDNG